MKLLDQHPQMKWYKDVIEHLKTIDKSRPLDIIIKPTRFRTIDDPPVLEEYFLKPLILWAPHLNFPRTDLHCTICKQVLTPTSWHPKLRHIFGDEQSYYLASFVYSCPSRQCKTGKEKKNSKKVLSTSDEIINSLQGFFRDSFPVYLTKNPES